MLRQQDHQSSVDIAGDPLGPSAGFAEPPGGVLGPEQPRVIEVAVLFAVETGEISWTVEQTELNPPGGRVVGGCRNSSWP